MLPSLRVVSAAGLLLAAGTFSGHAQGISDSQRVELSKMIREYLIANPEVVQDAIKELEKRKAVAESANNGKRDRVLLNVPAQGAPATMAGCPCMEMMMSGAMVGTDQRGMTRPDDHGSMNMPGMGAPSRSAGGTMGGASNSAPGGDKALLAGAEEILRTNPLLVPNTGNPTVSGIASAAARSSNLEKWAGQEPSPFTLQNLASTEVALSTYRGKPVVLHFFATWCRPCREEMEALRRFVARTNSNDLTVLAVSVGESDDRVRRFFDTMPVNFTVVLDRDMAVARAWRVAMLPTTYVLNAELKPKLFLRGEQQWDRLDAAQIVRKLDEVSR